MLYQSLWSRYLGLLLGHAAFAQTLVLVIFMGGLAIGSVVGGRLAERSHNPLLIYAIVEGLLALFGIGFHGAFVGAMNGLLYGDLHAGSWLKWALAASSVLPQTVMLGVTFPLMASVWMRLSQQAAGHSIAWLYFTNSLGAGLGVLVGIFVLVPTMGLPGTMLTAGLLNAVVALVAYGYSKQLNTPIPETKHYQTASDSSNTPSFSFNSRIILLVAAGTGLASFIYEIAWIRLLALALGASTHTFELMLSAFIVGLALGGFYVRNHKFKGNSALYLVAWVQVAMGLAALFSLLVLGQSFNWVSWFLNTVQRNADGYQLYTWFSSTVAYMAMLPATFLAGMTLPLLTHSLLQVEGKEGAVGRLYAVNTLGSIAGILLATYWLLPALGVDGAIILAAALDCALGLLLLAWLWQQQQLGRWSLANAFALVVLGLFLALQQAMIDPVKMASGVYRHGKIQNHDSTELVFHEDARTASITVAKEHLDTGEIVSVIKTNGKPDASLSSSDSGAPDERTMTLTALLPLLMHEQPSHIGNIGFGSGMTVDTALIDPRLKEVINVEIEPAMVEGARIAFSEQLPRVFTDPRVTMVYDDAKSYFANQNITFDILYSEPSNPWVSGVANLFTEEFYRFIKTRLNDKGIFLQWIQLYEIDTQLLTSILKPLDQHFQHYTAFTSNTDLLIVASNSNNLQSFDASVLEQPAMQRRLQRIGIGGTFDLSKSVLFSERLLRPWLRQHGIANNSDYFPIVALNAPEKRFARKAALELLSLQQNWIVQDLVNTPFEQISNVDDSLLFDEQYSDLNNLMAYWRGDEALRQGQPYVPLAVCHPAIAPAVVAEQLRMAVNASMMLESEEGTKRLLTLLKQHGCLERQPELAALFELYQSIALRDYPAVLANARQLLTQGSQLILPEWLRSYALWAALHQPSTTVADWLKPEVSDILINHLMYSMLQARQN
ncbi:fused MFS/spermidine synthase [Bacterioplanes sanyensis]|uniref:fused MFS/spermidine synthase n=1 Tax=Bacterioplanes sanyensis TaxID=1249553 RepID=UPI0016775FA1|nr:fused MFS/spermidine synthase [Bacterioplanes sanyensis]